MTRRIDTLEIYSLRRGQRRMELDFTIPASASTRSRLHLIPAALVVKGPAAPDLEVAEGGTSIPVPTRDQNIELTVRALAAIQAARRVRLLRRNEYGLRQDLRDLIGGVVREIPTEARVMRQRAVDLGVPADGWLVALLKRLEDHFVLWVPVSGRAGQERHLSLRRSEQMNVQPILFAKRTRRSQSFRVPAPGSTIPAEYDPITRWPRLDLLTALTRLLFNFGVMSVKFQQESLEAWRFCSYHLCIDPPPGLVVRDVGAGSIAERDSDLVRRPVDRFPDPTPGVSVPGADSRLGHVYLTRPQNPLRLYTRVTIGLRPDTTTLWAVVSVLTCLLLWAFHRDIHAITSTASSSQPRGQFVLALAPLDGVAGGLTRHAPYQQLNLTVAAAVLLVGPTFAAAWSLRENDRALLRNMLAGARLLLLGSAILSVSSALALTDVRPFGWSAKEAIGWYASLSYVIAVVLSIGWLQARTATWMVYRKLLHATKWNLAATFLLACLSLFAVTRIESFPVPAALTLFASGFGFAAVAGNRGVAPLGEVARLPAALASFGALMTLGLLSPELHFFNHVIHRGQAHLYLRRGELGLAIAAVVVLVVRFLYGRYRYYRSLYEGRPTHNRAADPPFPWLG